MTGTVRSPSVAERVDAFTQRVLSPFLNYHRLCIFPTQSSDPEGRFPGRSPPDTDIMTPYEKLRSLPGADGYLKPGTTFEQLDAGAVNRNDNEAARILTSACTRLFRSIEDGSR